jgi:hypothetical protein
VGGILYLKAVPYKEQIFFKKESVYPQLTVAREIKC